MKVIKDIEAIKVLKETKAIKVILTMEHYIKLLTIYIWKLAIFWSWQSALWNLGQLAPAAFFYLQHAHGHHVWDIYIVD